MSIQDLGALGEFIAAIATVATLAYLAIQIRNNTQLAKSQYQASATAAIQPYQFWRAESPEHAAMSGYAQINQTLTDPVIASVYLRGMQDPSQLNEEEWVQFLAFNRMWVNSLEKMLELNERNVLPKRIWVQVASEAYEILSSEGGQAVKVALPATQYLWDAIDAHSDKSKSITMGFETDARRNL